MNKVINAKELRNIIKESSQEFKARMGANVEVDNKKNNENSYKESEKRAKEFNGNLNAKASTKELDRSYDKNAGMLDYTPRIEPDKAYKERIKAQAKGYTSVEQEKKGSKNHDGEFDDNGRIYKAIKKNSNDRNEEKSALEHSGLVGSKMPKQEKNTMYETTTPKAKRLVFKKTVFTNESQMLSRIPEEYKIDGQKIYMRDMKDNEYIVECVKCSNGVIETNILNFNNENVLNEQISRMKELFNYDTKEAFSSNRKNENKHFNNTLNIARGLNDGE